MDDVITNKPLATLKASRNFGHSVKSDVLANMKSFLKNIIT
jgi:hypothetical protein